MTRFLSILPLRCAPDARERALAGFVAGGVLEKCRDVIPGFISGVLLTSLHDPAAASVLVEWENERAYLDWMHSPAREGLAGTELFEPPGRSHLFVVAHDVQRRPEP